MNDEHIQVEQAATRRSKLLVVGLTVFILGALAMRMLGESRRAELDPDAVRVDPLRAIEVAFAESGLERRPFGAGADALPAPLREALHAAGTPADGAGSRVKGALEAAMSPALFRVDRGRYPATAGPREPARLLAAVEAAGEGGALVVRPIELAWLGFVACRAAGLEPTFAMLGADRSPLVGGRSPLVARCGDQPLFSPPIERGEGADRPVSARQAATIWLIEAAAAARAASQPTSSGRLLALAGVLLPDDPRVRFHRAIAAIARAALGGGEDAAVQAGFDEAQAAIASQPDPWAQLLLADLWVALERPVDAWSVVEAVLKATPALPDALVSRAQLLSQRAEAAPQSMRDKLRADAKADFEAALKGDPNVDGARPGLASLAFAAGDRQGALDVLQAAVADGRLDVDAALLLAAMRTEAGEGAAAEALLARHASIGGTRVARARVEAALATGDAAKALELLEAAAKRWPEDLELAMQRADVLRGLSRVDDALAVLDGVRAEGAMARQLAMMQADLYIGAGRGGQAVALLEPLVEGPATDDGPEASEQRSRAELMLVVALLAGERGEESDARWRAAIDGGRIGAVDLAGVFLQLDEGQRALDALRYSLRPARPFEPETALMLGVLLTASGDKDGAVAARDALAERLPKGERAAFVADYDSAVAAAEAELSGAVEQP